MYKNLQLNFKIPSVLQYHTVHLESILKYILGHIPNFDCILKDIYQDIQSNLGYTNLSCTKSWIIRIFCTVPAKPTPIHWKSELYESLSYTNIRIAENICFRRSLAIRITQVWLYFRFWNVSNDIFHVTWENNRWFHTRQALLRTCNDYR